MGSDIGSTHIDMPYSTQGTDGGSLSIAVKNCLTDFSLCVKVVAHTCAGGSNLHTCKAALKQWVTNKDVFYPVKPILSKLHGTCTTWGV